MKIKLATTILLSLTVSACGDNNERAIGVYKHSAALTGTEIISEVKKDGDTYLFVGDAIKNKNIIALSKTSDGLSYNNIPLKISEDGNTLYFGKINGTRVDASYLADRMAAIENNKKICAELQAEADKNAKTMSKEQWNEYNKSLKTKTPDGCRIIGAGMRW
ncbi:MAG: hypothetical protein LPK18_05615 [Pseudomonadaceae bacterium]|nr:hypothetical protein [Pseudomonadaceae bacterium]